MLPKGFMYRQKFSAKNVSNWDYLIILWRALFDRDPNKGEWQRRLADFSFEIDCKIYYVIVSRSKNAPLCLLSSARRRAQILVLEILNVFLWLRFSPFLTSGNFEHFETGSRIFDIHFENFNKH